MVDRAGERFAEYRLVRRLGGGTFGDVYLSEHINDKTPAAIKILQARLVNKEDLKDFINEVRILFRLQHPNIVPLKDFGIEHDVPFLVMDYASHGTLRQPKGHRLPIDVVVIYIRQIAAALQYAHDRKLIHRDVKPDNILLGPADQVWLSDFGIASIAHSSRSLNTQEGAGTIAYMAPEQIMGKPRLASDQYALGIIVYEWLSGQRPFQGTSTEVAIQHTQAPPPSLREIVPTISPAVEEVVMTALSKEAHQRFASIQAFARALEQAGQQEPTIPSAIPNEATPVLYERLASPPLAMSTLELVSPKEPVIPLTDPPIPQKEPASILPIPETPPAPVNMQHREPSKRKRTLALATLLFIVIAGTVGAYFPIHSHIVAGQQATATANALASATAEAPIIATAHARATVTAAFDAYNRDVAANGIMNGFDARHTRFNPYEKVIDPQNVSGLVQDWTASTSYLIGASSPAIANGIAYIGSFDHDLYAFNASGCGQVACSPLWTASTGQPISGSPAVAGGVVYVGSWDDKLYAFNASGCGQAVCSPLWTASTGAVITSSPTVANGVVYIGSWDHKFYAFNASGCGQTTCSPLWTAFTGSNMDSTPAVANGVVYTGSWDDKLYAFNASGCGQATCSPLWTASTGGYIKSSPAVVNGVVYIGSWDHNLYAFNASGCGQATCSPLWTASTGNVIFSSPAVVNGIVYVGSDDHKFYALSASGCGHSSCQALWTASVGNGIDSSSSVVANGVVYIGSLDGKLYAFNTAGCGQSVCSPLWSFSTGYGILSSPAVANGVVYVGSEDGKLYAFHLPGTTP